MQYLQLIVQDNAARIIMTFCQKKVTLGICNYNRNQGI